MRKAQNQAPRLLARIGRAPPVKDPQRPKPRRKKPDLRDVEHESNYQLADSVRKLAIRMLSCVPIF